MIEIKAGWTGKEAFTQTEVRRLSHEINRMNRKLEEALEQRAVLQASCDHNHVLFSGQEMTCEVCDARISQ